jgi:hypothetical protein
VSVTADLSLLERIARGAFANAGTTRQAEAIPPAPDAPCRPLGAFQRNHGR